MSGSVQSQSINSYSGVECCLMNNPSSRITITLLSFFARGY